MMIEAMRSTHSHLWFFVGKLCLSIVWVIALLAIASCSDNSLPSVDLDTNAEIVGSIPEEVSADIHIAMHGTKISQLVGDFDRELSEPTNNLTYTRYNLEATDLGASFQHGDRTYILFGDTWGIIGGDRDAYAYTTDADPEDGLDLNFVTDENNNYYPLTISGISQASFEVPMEGVSVNGKMYIYHTTDHSAQVTMGRSVIARADDQEALTFTKLYDFSNQKFINLSIVKVNSADWELLPENSGEGLVILGSGSYRNSQVYLAFQPASEIEDHNAIRYFAGIDWDGKPLWKNMEKDALPIFKLANPCVGELSVSYNQFIKRWILLYNCDDPRGINLRTAEYPWGPWTQPQILFHPWDDGGYCHFIHASYEAQQCDQVQDPGRENEWGGEYGPYQFESLAKGDDETTTIYFTMSTWNPYSVLLMKAILDIKEVHSEESISIQRSLNTEGSASELGPYRDREIITHYPVQHGIGALLADINTGQSIIPYINESLADESIPVDIGPDPRSLHKNSIRTMKAKPDIKTIDSDNISSTQRLVNTNRKIKEADPYRVKGIFVDLAFPDQSSALLEDTRTGQSVVYFLNEITSDQSTLADIESDHIILEKNGIRKRSYFDRSGNEKHNLSTHDYFDNYRKITNTEWDLKPYQVFDGKVDDKLNFSINLKRRNYKVEGLQIDDIEDNALADELGLKGGDVIVEVNSVPINSLFLFVKACYDAGNSDEVILRIRRANRYVTLKYNLNWEGEANWSTSDVLHSKALSTMLLKNLTGNYEEK